MLAFFLHTILILHHQSLYLSFHLTICRSNNILIPSLVFLLPLHNSVANIPTFIG